MNHHYLLLPFYISNIIGHPYFDRISVGHRCRYFPILISFGDVAGLGVSDAGAVLIAYQMIASQFFLSMHQAPIASGMELAGYGEKTVMSLALP